MLTFNAEGGALWYATLIFILYCDPTNLTIHLTAHTISQRIRTLKKIPPELIPIGMSFLNATSNTEN